MLYYFFLSLRKGLGRVHVEEQKAKEMGLPNGNDPQELSRARASRLRDSDTKDTQAAMTHPLSRGNQLTVVDGELPRSNPLWLGQQGHMLGQ